jgi:hypothetical protein
MTKLLLRLIGRSTALVSSAFLFHGEESEDEEGENSHRFFSILIVVDTG